MVNLPAVPSGSLRGGKKHYDARVDHVICIQYRIYRHDVYIFYTTHIYIIQSLICDLSPPYITPQFSHKAFPAQPLGIRSKLDLLPVVQQLVAASNIYL